MDCVLCAYDFEDMKLNFAAANNPLWLVREGQLIEYKPDKMPVGKYGEDHASFNMQTVDLKKGDIVYTFTDGYADQFGGPKGKKFKYKQLEDTLLANHHLPMEEQKTVLNTKFESWKGNLEQVDDVLVIGIKI
jgi:serine phosphatase RsbU (regulator of sigma subunit)